MSEYGGVEIYFDLDYLIAIPQVVVVDTDLQFTPQFSPDNAGTDTYKLAISMFSDVDSNAFLQCKSYSGSDLVDRSDYMIGINDDIDRISIRVFIANTICSVYANEKWVYSYVMKSALYNDDGYVAVSLLALVEDVTLENITRVELRDKREAVWVDYEATSMSAIQSIIQQRPIEIFPHQGRKLKFTYIVGQESVDAVFVRKHSNRASGDANVSVDGLVYGLDVAISTYPDAAEEIGFATKLYRLSELDYGTVRAARIMQEKAYESTSTSKSDGRFDPRLEQGDIYSITQTLSGTERVIQEDVIIEDISFSLADGKNQMTVRGRVNK